jgi:hypothetical protein
MTDNQSLTQSRKAAEVRKEVAPVVFAILRVSAPLRQIKELVDIPILYLRDRS